MIPKLQSNVLGTDLDADNHALLNAQFDPIPSNVLGTDDSRLSDGRIMEDGSVTNKSVSDTAKIAQSKLSLNGVIPSGWLADDGSPSPSSAERAAKGNKAEFASRKGAASGYASLDSNARVPVAQLPSTGPGVGTVTYVDLSMPQDEFNVSGGPVTGGAGTIHAAARHPPDKSWFGVFGPISPGLEVGKPTFVTKQFPIGLIPNLPTSKFTTGRIDPLLLPVAKGMGTGHAPGMVTDPGFANIASGPIPIGIFCLNTGTSGTPIPDSVLSNPDIAGISIGDEWAQLEATEGVFDFSRIDAYFDQCESAGKFILLRILTMGGKKALGGHTPDWIFDPGLGIEMITFTDPRTGKTYTIPLFWDATFLAKKTAMIAALGARYASHPKLRIISASYGNALTEDWFPPDALAPVYDHDLFVGAGGTILDATNTAFPDQLIYTAVGDVPFTVGEPNRHSVCFEVRDNFNSTHDDHILFLGRNSVSNVMTEAPPPVGNQMYLLWNSRPDISGQDVWFVHGDTSYRMNGGTPGDETTILKGAMTRFAEYSPNWLEVFLTDCVNLTEAITYGKSVIIGQQQVVGTSNQISDYLGRDMKWRPIKADISYQPEVPTADITLLGYYRGQARIQISCPLKNSFTFHLSTPSITPVFSECPNPSVFLINPGLTVAAYAAKEGYNLSNVSTFLVPQEPGT